MITDVVEDDPPDTPETTPPTDVTVADVNVPLVHVPPVIGLLNVIVDPAHTDVNPDIVPGKGVTLTVIVGEAHPLE